MRFSARSKVGIILSVITILTVVSGFMVMTISSRGTPTHAASSAGIKYSTGHGRLAKQKTNVVRSKAVHLKASHKVFAAPNHFGKANANTARAAAQGAPAVGSLSVLKSHVNEGTILNNFDALSGVDNANLAGVLVHPPDQGLCAGHDSSISGNPNVEFELINLAVAEFDTAGNVQTSALMPFGKESLNVFFGEPGIPFFGGELVSDPRCIYDKSTDTFFFSVLGICSPAVGCFTSLESHMDLIVYNATSGAAAEYTIDDTNPANPGCPCLGDQTKIGTDNHAVYLSNDEFQGLDVGGTIENGADVYVLSKSQLVNQVTTLFTAFFDISIGGIPVTSLQPAISTSSTKTEYLVNSFPFLSDGEANPTAHTLGFWTVTGDENVTDGDFGAVVLAGKIIKSEHYAFPVLALSTGDFGLGTSPFLNPDDSRLQTCQFVNVDTWCSLTTAVAINGDPETRDGVAWFKISRTGHIDDQGIVASAGNYLIYPGIVHTSEGTTTVVYTITSPVLDPSAAYSIRKSGRTKFGGVIIAALGVDPSTDGAGRWGDYSFAVLDINGKDTWMATEYIPPVTNQNPVTNFGTRVFEVSGDH